eukprot:CAMPEP_0118885374 /NCGR_PEP_ID=MMETSP1163-20130328/23877_1 /TAXON_ID=124430 /ORGANISM="Phaeomonas parva, Strain CCMP2877" /LENGTH=106 /DNA_ID=CAMNT_0006823381 /DNA_START=147 /DNA_END=464 /DNA_ORIENTATION=-
MPSPHPSPRLSPARRRRSGLTPMTTLFLGEHAGGSRAAMPNRTPAPRCSRHQASRSRSTTRMHALATLNRGVSGKPSSSARTVMSPPRASNAICSPLSAAPTPALR